MKTIMAESSPTIKAPATVEMIPRTLAGADATTPLLRTIAMMPSTRATAPHIAIDEIPVTDHQPE